MNSVCRMEDVGIICGKSQRRRRRRGTDYIEEEVDEVNLKFDLLAIKVYNPTNIMC